MGLEWEAPSRGEVDLELVRELWLRYVGQGISVPMRARGMRGEIRDSWERSQHAHVNPLAPQLVVLDDVATERTLAGNASLIEVAYPYLVEFQKVLGDEYGEVTLTDRLGAQLRRIGGTHDLLKATERRKMLNGTVFSEESAGTNGIGLAQRLGRPVVVLGPEHFLAMYQQFACYATPIFDPSGDVVGYLNATAPLEAYDPRILGALVIASHGIRGELALRPKGREDELPTLGEAEANVLRDALIVHHGNVRAAAESLGVPLSTMYRKLSLHGVVARDFRGE